MLLAYPKDTPLGCISKALALGDFDAHISE